LDFSRSSLLVLPQLVRKSVPQHPQISFFLPTIHSSAFSQS
jgi:trehalose-6-phosphate synthase